MSAFLLYVMFPLEIPKAGQVGTAIHIHKHNKYPISGQLINQPTTTRDEQTNGIIPERHQ